MSGCIDEHWGTVERCLWKLAVLTDDAGWRPIEQDQACGHRGRVEPALAHSVWRRRRCPERRWETRAHVHTDVLAVAAIVAALTAVLVPGRSCAPRDPLLRAAAWPGCGGIKSCAGGAFVRAPYYRFRAKPPGVVPGSCGWALRHRRSWASCPGPLLDRVDLRSQMPSHRGT